MKLRANRRRFLQALAATPAALFGAKKLPVAAYATSRNWRPAWTPYNKVMPADQQIYDRINAMQAEMFNRQSKMIWVGGYGSGGGITLWPEAKPGDRVTIEYLGLK